MDQCKIVKKDGNRCQMLTKHPHGICGVHYRQLVDGPAHDEALYSLKRKHREEFAEIKKEYEASILARI